jgi:small subunit ribosomal protein S13
MSDEFRHRLRIIDTDVDGTLKVYYALAKIKGVGPSLANAMLRKAGISPDKRAGFLAEAEIERLEEIIKDPAKSGLPSWLMNRRKDQETGKDIHLISSELVLRTKMDIEKMKEIKSWRGYRHAYGLKVRGQRTKTTGRAGKALGVKKKTLMQRPAATENK